MTSPKKALEQILEHGSRPPFRSEILKNQSEDPILNTQARMAKATIPVAELYGEIVELMEDTPITQEETSDWIDKREILLAQLEALK